MSRADDLDQHLEVLVRLRRSAGGDVYDRALLAAKVAVARVILGEVERRLGVGRPSKGQLIRFRRRKEMLGGRLTKDRGIDP